MRRALPLALTLAVACQTPPPPPPAAPPAEPLEARAAALAQRVIIADGHVDLPYRLWEGRDAEGHITEDVSVRTEGGDFDYVRARAGGLDAPFMSIYVPAKLQATPGRSKAEAEGLIALVEGLVAAHPDKFQLATHPDQIPAIKAAGKIALPMGMENGSALEDDVANVRYFHQRGIRYITLAHSKDNLLCDSSYDTRHTHEGLSELGRQVVKEMNAVGIMVDVSHVSDDVVRQVVALSATPVIASHSSARHFTPGFERNLSDELIQGIAAGGGVVLVNFGSTFISARSRAAFEARRAALVAHLGKDDIDWQSHEVQSFLHTWDHEHPSALATVADVADHIEHIAKLVGVEHVGFGSDFDGVGPTTPEGLRDASQLPNLLAELLRRGFSEEDLEKVASGNLFRVWRAVAAHAEAQP
jgi:membrane dipeptidase